MAIERMHMCNECIFLSSDILGRWMCTRPDGSGNHKAHPYVGACVDFKPKKTKKQ